VFQFKQFTIHQDQCGMKIAIDSCIFGANVSIVSGSKVLDIGTGTGLLSLMIAQKNDVRIDAVEIDESAFLQAKSNIELSPFNSKLTIYKSDIKDFKEKDYDFIIINPPFFENNNNLMNAQKSKAKHQSDFNLHELAEIINGKLKTTGTLAILLPLDRMALFDTEMRSLGFHKSKSLVIKHQPDKPYIREVAEFNRETTPCKNAELCIKEADNVTYSNEFQQLMKDYYIIF
jgi:tRNA1Val (adenine37-N6)-methyltransferase